MAQRITERERKSKAASKIKARRQRMAAIWHKLFIMFIAVGVLVSATLAYAVWSGAAERFVVELMDKGYQRLAQAGFAVERMDLNGRSRTPMRDVEQAIGFKTGEPIFRVDLGELKERLEAIPTVKHASVERALPDTLHIQLKEREPVAVWQNNGKFALIDDTGAVMPDLEVNKYKNLPLLVGFGAPEHVGEVMAMFDARKDLAPQVVAAIRIGNRRWDVNFKQGIKVKLPEEHFETAWLELATMQQDQQILLRDIQTIDMRDRERMYITVNPRDTSPSNFLPTKDT